MGINDISKHYSFLIDVRPCHAVLVLTKVPWEILITPQKTIDSRATLSGCVILFHLQHHKPTSSAACEAGGLVLCHRPDNLCLVRQFLTLTCQPFTSS